MPQLNLVNEDSVPWRLDIRVEPFHLDANKSILTVELHGHHGALIHKTQGAYVGVMCDYLPAAAQAAVEAYLWGDDGRAVMKAVSRVRLSAVTHRLDWLTRHPEP